MRINPIKPVQPQHMDATLPPEMYYAGFSRLLELCRRSTSAATDCRSDGLRRRAALPCGRTSFRIHSITPDGKVHVSPCVYLHDYKAPLDLLEHELADIIRSPQFHVFRQRNANPDAVSGCAGCAKLAQCGGCAGVHTCTRCTARASGRSGRATPTARFARHPAIPFPQQPELLADTRLVHMDYLCTWIGKPI